MTYYATALSTILGIHTILQSRKRTKRTISINASVEEGKNLCIELFNSGFRAYTITTISLIYGTQSRDGQKILELDFDKAFDEPVLKQEAEDYKKLFIDHEQILEKVRSKKVKQMYNHMLWIHAGLSTGESKSVPVSINDGNIDDKGFRNARKFIAYDLYLGFKQMESQFTYMSRLF